MIQFEEPADAPDHETVEKMIERIRQRGGVVLVSGGGIGAWRRDVESASSDREASASTTKVDEIRMRSE